MRISTKLFSADECDAFIASLPSPAGLLHLPSVINFHRHLFDGSGRGINYMVKRELGIEISEYNHMMADACFRYMFIHVVANISLNELARFMEPEVSPSACPPFSVPEMRYCIRAYTGDRYVRLPEYPPYGCDKNLYQALTWPDSVIYKRLYRALYYIYLRKNGYVLAGQGLVDPSMLENVGIWDVVDYDVK